MTDENANTADLTMDEKLDRILTDLAHMKTALNAHETAGAGSTRPLLDQIIREVVEIRDRLIEETAQEAQAENLVMVFGNQLAQDEFNREHPALIERIPAFGT